MYRRLDYATAGLAKLGEYEEAANKQNDILDNIQKNLDDDNLSQVKTDSGDIKKQIEDHEVLYSLCGKYHRY